MTTLNLPPGITEERAIEVAKKHREMVWRTISGPEDRRLDALIDICSAMCRHDRKSGERLARLALWSPSP